MGYESSAGQIAQILPTPSNTQAIRLRAVHLTGSSTTWAQGDLQSPSGTAIASSTLWAGNPFDIPDFHSYPLPVGTGLYLYTNAAEAILGTILYDVY
jgi:hypothetical protein